MGFFCNNCGLAFKRQENLDYHITNKSCLDKKHYCDQCNKGFTTKNSMYRHMKHSCKNKNKLNDFEKELDKLKEENIKLRSERKDLEKRFIKMEKVMKNNATSINNGTIINNDNRVTNNITIVAYGKEDMSQIDREDIIKALKTGFNSTKHLTEVVHFNPKYPKYSNIRRSNFNMKNKIMYHNGNQWVTTTDPHMIDDLYNRKRDFIEENIDDYQDGLTERDLVKLNRWLGIEDDDNRITKIKDELREMLFNKKSVSELNEQTIDYDEKECDSTNDPNKIEDLDREAHDTYILIKADDIRKPITEEPIRKKQKRTVALRNGRYRKPIKASARRSK